VALLKATWEPSHAGGGALMLAADYPLFDLTKARQVIFACSFSGIKFIFWLSEKTKT
jgi:hypothetical protein